MTYYDIYVLALGLLAESPQDAADYEAQVLPLMNIMLTELFDANNSVLLWREKPQLADVPVAQELGGEAAYEDELCRGVMPFGLAARLALDDDAGKAAYFAAEYAARQRYFLRADSGTVKDVY